VSSSHSGTETSIVINGHPYKATFLGSGTFNEVYKIEQPDGRFLALKIPKKDSVISRPVRAARLAQRMTRVLQPQIVEVSLEGKKKDALLVKFLSDFRQAGGVEIGLALIEIFVRHGRVVTDGHARNNFVVVTSRAAPPMEETLLIDWDQAFHPGSDISKDYLFKFEPDKTKWRECLEYFVSESAPFIAKTTLALVEGFNPDVRARTPQTEFKVAKAAFSALLSEVYAAIEGREILRRFTRDQDKEGVYRFFVSVSDLEKIWKTAERLILCNEAYEKDPEHAAFVGSFLLQFYQHVCLFQTHNNCPALEALELNVRRNLIPEIPGLGLAMIQSSIRDIFAETVTTDDPLFRKLNERLSSRAHPITDVASLGDAVAYCKGVIAEYSARGCNPFKRFSAAQRKRNQQVKKLNILLDPFATLCSAIAAEVTPRPEPAVVFHNPTYGRTVPTARPSVPPGHDAPAP
jgi:hypothetical protein